jgi:predicted alpha/beta-fold hydrolase
MTNLLLLIAAVTLLVWTVLLGLWWAHLRFWRARLHVPLAYEHVEEIAMPDGGTIELRRVRAPGQDAHEGCPVVLIHGLAMNHRNHDTAQDSSFRFLSERGRDVWLITPLRGRAVRSNRPTRRTALGPRLARRRLPHGVNFAIA